MGFTQVKASLVEVTENATGWCRLRVLLEVDAEMRSPVQGVFAQRCRDSGEGREEGDRKGGQPSEAELLMQLTPRAAGAQLHTSASRRWCSLCQRSPRSPPGSLWGLTGLGIELSPWPWFIIVKG